MKEPSRQYAIRTVTLSEVIKAFQEVINTRGDGLVTFPENLTVTLLNAPASEDVVAVTFPSKN